MRRLLPLALLLVSCGQGMLPSKPRVSGVWGNPTGDRLEINWYYLEGADRYEVWGIDSTGEAKGLYSGTDTTVSLGERYPYYLVVAYAPSDVQSSDTVKVAPIGGDFLLRSYGSGFRSAICYKPDTTKDAWIFPCDPESPQMQPNLLLILDSLTLVSPLKDTAKFGSLHILYAPGPSDMAPLPPSGYADTFPVAVGETVAVWIDRGIAGTFDLTDNVLRVVLDSVYLGDGSRDSIRVWLGLRYQLVPRLRWY